MIWLFQLASFTGAFPSQVNGINALGSLHSCSEDKILAGRKTKSDRILFALDEMLCKAKSKFTSIHSGRLGKPTKNH